MICIENTLGTISISKKFFSDVIEKVISESVGVLETVPNCVSQKIKSLMLNETVNGSGISINREDDKLFINLHLKIKYGVNISEVVKSLVSKIKYLIEDYTGFAVEKINVRVDKIGI